MTDLIRVAKAIQERAEAAEDKAEQHYIALGKKLADIKTKFKEDKQDGKHKDTTWAAFVKKHFGYSQPRADNLIRIGAGELTVEKLREDRRESVKKSREKKTNGEVKMNGQQPLGSSLSTPFTNRAGVTKSACDFNPEDPNDVADAGDPPEMTRRQIFINMTDATMHNASVVQERFFGERPDDKASASEATAELVKETKAAIAAWTAILKKLQQLKSTNGKGLKTDGKETSDHSAVH